jgi:hypothetical protein
MAGKEDEMADDKHEKALYLTEQALDKLVEGDEAGAQKLIDKAKKLDISAPQEVLRDMEEDARNRR